jgi:hypothetical protein
MTVLMMAGKRNVEPFILPGARSSIADMPVSVLKRSTDQRHDGDCDVTDADGSWKTSINQGYQACTLLRAESSERNTSSGCSNGVNHMSSTESLPAHDGEYEGQALVADLVKVDEWACAQDVTWVTHSYSVELRR